LVDQKFPFCYNIHIDSKKEFEMDKMIRATSYGEVGIDTEASPGNGQFYARTYDGELDAVGFDTVEEAWAELEFVACGTVDAEFDE
jgi:hypothetical protein